LLANSILASHKTNLGRRVFCKTKLLKLITQSLCDRVCFNAPEINADSRGTIGITHERVPETEICGKPSELIAAPTYTFHVYGGGLGSECRLREASWNGVSLWK